MKPCRARRGPLPFLGILPFQAIMSYSLVADEEAGAYPPAYSSSSTTNAQNYVYLSASEDLVTSLLIDTDQPAIFGRFKDEQEQKDAKNALLAGHFVDVKVNLKGSQKAKIEVQAKDYTFQRRVVQIVSLRTLYWIRFL